MKVNLLLAASLAIFIVAGVACKPDNLSQLKHDFGNTRVEPTNLVDCHKTPSPNFVAKPDQFPKAQEFLKNVANHIMKSNSQTFNGSYDPARFCFGVTPSPEFNAFAVYQYREVSFNSGTFERFNNDAEVAAIMAHELAHITMQHKGILTHSDMAKVGRKAQGLMNQSSQLSEQINQLSGQLFEVQYEVWQMFDSIAAASPADKLAVSHISDMEEILRSNQSLSQISPSQWAQYQQKLDGYYSEIMGGNDAENGVAVKYKVGEITRIEAQINTLSLQQFSNDEEFTRIAQQKLGGPEQIANGREREADEVGYEFYLRAGMSPNHYVTALSETVQPGPEDNQYENLPFLYCLRNMFKTMRLEPSRGVGSHPTGCWRLYNIVANENLKHKDDYAKFMQAATRISIPGPVTLAEVKAEIRAGIPNNDLQPPSGEFPNDPTDFPQPTPEEEKEWELQAQQSNARKKALCEQMQGQWIQDPFLTIGNCKLPNLATHAEKKAYCARYNSFWHSDTCQCLPIEWQGQNIDPNTCAPSGAGQPNQPQGPLGGPYRIP